MTYLLHILTMSCIYIILTLSLNLIVGYTGIPSLGHAAFSAVGAYASALLALKLGLPFWIGLIAAACVGGLFGVIIGFPALRLKGDYLALVSFGFAVIVYSILNNWVSFTRGPMGMPGIPKPSVFGFRFDSTISYLILAAALAALTTFVVRRIVIAPFGRILKAIREDEAAALAMGKDVTKCKILVFVIGAMFAGMAGSLYAHYITFIDPSSFTVMESILILLMVVFGGMGSIPGSILGAVTLILFPELLRFLGMPSSIAASTRQMIYGLLLVVLMLKRPRGLIGEYEFK